MQQWGNWLDQLEEQARAALPAPVYDWVAGGAAFEDNLRRSVAAWRAIPLRPDALVDVTDVRLCTTLLGDEIGHPVGVAPSGFHGLIHPDGEAATAAAAARHGGLFVLSSRASLPIEQVAAVSGLWWFQAYVMRARHLTESLVVRASALGARAIVLTVDTSVVARRRRNRDRSLIGIDTLQANTGPVADPLDLEPATDLTPADIEWLGRVSGLPVVVKGVLRADTARRCVDAGAAAVWVSSHGGRQLDGAITSAEALADIVTAVGADAEVYVDGGISGGADVVRALALGARAVFVGRPAVWGLAADGTDGVSSVLEHYIDELRLCLRLCGRPDVGLVAADLLGPVR